MKDRVITKKEIEEILIKYNIGKKPLSLVLGWGEVTIIRYLDGGIPDKLHSDVLFSIKNNHNKMLEYLNKNKDLITNLAYKKVIVKIGEMEEELEKDNIYLISKYIIQKLEDTTPLALQKILYYIDGFSLALLGISILEYSPEAWVHGPVYRNIYDYYCHYKFNPIDKNNECLNLEILDKNVLEIIDGVINSFGCYSGKVLENMTHLSSSWLDAREGLFVDEISDKLISKDKMREEFICICQKYHIDNFKDISRYSIKLFRKVMK